MNSLITNNRPCCSLSVEALKRDGVNKRSNASMDKSFDGMHEKYRKVRFRFDSMFSKKNDFDFDDRNISTRTELVSM